MHARIWFAAVPVIAIMAPVSIAPASVFAETTATPAFNTSDANAWAEMVLRGVDNEFPTKLSLVYTDADQIGTPREHFPAFYGCFDWHSSVHGHWVLVRLLDRFPDMASASRVRVALKQHLTNANLQAEADFFARDENKSFERMYGWAWLFRLAMELDASDDPDARSWRTSLRPLEEVLVSRTMAYLPLLTFPIRTGQHADTGFALGQIIDYARATGREALEQLAIDRAKAFYATDTNYPVQYEPSGHDFFSSGWNEADLMRRVMPPQDFVAWFERFLPKLANQLVDGTIEPVTVSDLSDGKLVHLAGLNLNRAWCMASISRALGSDHRWHKTLRISADSHLRAGLEYINSGHYEGDHWLATFGLFALHGVGDGVDTP